MNARHGTMQFNISSATGPPKRVGQQWHLPRKHIIVRCPISALQYTAVVPVPKRSYQVCFVFDAFQGCAGRRKGLVS